MPANLSRLIGATGAMLIVAASAIAEPSPAPESGERTAEHHALMDQMLICVSGGVSKELAAGAHSQDEIVDALRSCSSPLVASGYMTQARAEAVYREAVQEALQHLINGDDNRQY